MMQPEAPQNLLLPLFRMIRTRLRTAHSVADAADACITANSSDGAFRMLLDIERPMHGATALLNAASHWRLEQEN
jgi:hypothetical protein